MGKISITIQDRSYRLNCGDGEEQRLQELAAYISDKADALTKEHGRIGESHLLLMSAIMIADELFDQRAVKAADSSEAKPDKAGEPV